MIKIQIVRRVSQKEILALNCTCQKKLWCQPNYILITLHVLMTIGVKKISHTCLKGILKNFL